MDLTEHPAIMRSRQLGIPTEDVTVARAVYAAAQQGVRRVLERNKRSAWVFIMRHGMTGEPPRLFRELGSDLNVSPQNAFARYNKAAADVYREIATTLAAELSAAHHTRSGFTQ